MKPLTVTLVFLLGSLALAQPRHGTQTGQESGMQMGQGMNMADMMMPVESEIDFIQGMIVHHQEAVDSARKTLNRTERPELRAFSAGVVEVQEREIESLRGWLGAWYPDAMGEIPYTPMMRNMADATPDEADRTLI